MSTTLLVHLIHILTHHSTNPKFGIPRPVAVPASPKRLSNHYFHSLRYCSDQMGFSSAASFRIPIPIPFPSLTTRRNASIPFHSIPQPNHPFLPPIPRFSLHSNLNSTNILTLRRKASSNGRDFRAHSSSPNSPPPPTPSSSDTTSISQQVLLSSALTISFAVANRVLYKLALVPMKEYPFFLAQLTTFG